MGFDLSLIDDDGHEEFPLMYLGSGCHADVIGTRAMFSRAPVADMTVLDRYIEALRTQCLTSSTVAELAASIKSWIERHPNAYWLLW